MYNEKPQEKEARSLHPSQWLSEVFSQIREEKQKSVKIRGNHGNKSAIDFSIKKVFSGNHAMYQLVKVAKPARRKSSQCLHSSETQKCAAELQGTS